MKKTYRIKWLVLAVIIFSFFAMLVKWFLREKSPIEWAEKYSNLEIPNEITIIDFNRFENMQGYQTRIILQATEEEMNGFLDEATNYKPLPIAEDEWVALNSIFHRKYRDVRAQGLYLNTAVISNHITTIVLDDRLNQMIVFSQSLP